MTIDECRDRIAGIVGWKNRPDTIDGIVEIWPAGWCFEVCRNEFGVAAQARRDGEPWCVGITEGRNCHTEYEARLRLLLAVLEKENTNDATN